MLGVTRSGPLGPVRAASHQDVVDSLDPAVGALPVLGGSGSSNDPAPVSAPRNSDETDAWAILAGIEHLGPVTLTRLVGALGTGQAVLDVARQPDGVQRLAALELRRMDRPEALGRELAERIASAAQRASETLATIAAHGLDVVTIDDAEYPRRLREIELPPPVLFVRGSLAVLDAPKAVAVVGTRRPTEHGRAVASRIAAAVARADAVVVSGLAVGIDGAAHAATVAVGRPTVAVLGGGHGRLFPAAHRRLAEAIVDAGGTIVSELAPWVQPRRGTFPRRNRLISGLSDATVVVEAGSRSGALSTASWALEQGRECFLVPGALDAPASVGCLRFLREQAGLAHIVAGVPEPVEDLGLGEGARPATADRRSGAVGRAAILADLGDAEATVAAAILDGARTLDEIVAGCGLAVATVLGAVTLLELRGHVVDALGRYRPAGVLATIEPVRGRRRGPRTASPVAA